MSMKIFSDIIGNLTHDLQTCNTVPQPTATPRADLLTEVVNMFFICVEDYSEYDGLLLTRNEHPGCLNFPQYYCTSCSHLVCGPNELL